MLTITGNGRLTRDVKLHTTQSGKSVATVSVASDRRDRKSDPVYVDLILWEGHAEAAAQHLVKGQAIAFSGRLEPRAYETSSGEQRVALEVRNVDLEYGARPRGQGTEPADEPGTASTPSDDDIPF
jgi:single-strand DNA-binding protein